MPVHFTECIKTKEGFVDEGRDRESPHIQDKSSTLPAILRDTARKAKEFFYWAF